MVSLPTNAMRASGRQAVSAGSLTCLVRLVTLAGYSPPGFAGCLSDVEREGWSVR